MTSISKKIRAPDLALMKKRSERIVMLTAYDATMARLLDQAGVDLLLVGDSLGHVILGLNSTIPVTLDQVIHHTRAVAQGASRALVVADMPFLTYQISPADAMRSAARLFQEGGAAEGIKRGRSSITISSRAPFSRPACIPRRAVGPGSFLTNNST
jgi:3-methyl-2-oxobutanoate hydroxymethyltransferase